VALITFHIKTVTNCLNPDLSNPVLTQAHSVHFLGSWTKPTWNNWGLPNLSSNLNRGGALITLLSFWKCQPVPSCCCFFFFFFFLLVESFGLLNDLFPLPTILDAGYPVCTKHHFHQSTPCHFLILPPYTSDTHRPVLLGNTVLLLLKSEELFFPGLKNVE